MINIITIILLAIILILLVLILINLKNQKTNIKKEDTNFNSIDLKKYIGECIDVLAINISKIEISNTYLIDNINKNLDDLKNEILSSQDEKIYSIKDYKHKIENRINKNINDILEKITKNIDDDIKLNSNIQDDINKIKVCINDIVEKNLDSVVEKVNTKLEYNFNNTNEIIRKIENKISIVDDSSLEVKSLSESINSLNTILQNNKKTGVFGELIIENILSNVYGKDSKLFDRQYELKIGKETKRPDIVIFLENSKLLCIDSKLPFEIYNNYIENKNDATTFKKGIKNHINEVSKYLQSELSIDMCMMFLPSDNVYLTIYNEFYDELYEYAKSKNVLITSPSTLIPYIKTVKQIEKSYKVKKESNEIIDLLRNLIKYNENYEKDLSATIKNLDTLLNNFDKLRKDKNNLEKIFKNSKKIESE